MKFKSFVCVAVSAAALSGLTGCDSGTPESSIRSAKAHLARNEDRAAIIELKNALQKDGQAAEARFLLGRALLDIGDPKSAAVELGKALDAKYPASQVVPVLANALNMDGRLQEISTRYADMTLDDPAANADLKSTVASAYLQLGNRQKAEAQLALALKSAPGYPPGQVMQARMLATDRDFDGALRLVGQVLTANPGLSDAWKLKGDLLYFAKQDAEGALEAYRAALKLKPGLMGAQSGMLAVLVAKKDFKAAEAQLARFKAALPGSPEAKYYEALIAFHNDNFKVAKQIAQQLLTLAPENPRVLHLAGAVELQAGAYLQAENYAGKALQNSPGNASALRLLGQTYIGSGQPAKALATLLPYVERGSGDADMVALVANAYLLNGDVKEAEAYFARAARMNPNDMGSRTALALTRLTTGNVDAAFDELQSISSIDSGTTADLALISALFQRKEYDAALKSIATLESKDPKNPLAPMLRGRVELARNQPAAARASFERAIGVSPLYFPAAAALASLDITDKKFDAAQQRFEKILAVDRKNLAALLAIAQLRQRMGASADEVNRLLADAIHLNPTEPAPRLLLIDRLVAAKESKLAMAAAQEAVAAVPDNPALIEALGRIQMSSGESNQAVASFSKMVELRPQSPEPYLRLAEAYVALKQTDSAVHSLQRALAVAPDAVSAQRALLSVLLVSKRNNEARALARSVQAQHPNESLGFLFEGEVDAALKNWDAAADAFRAGLDRQKTTGLAVKLHTALLQAGKRADADRLALAWTKEFPKDDVFFFYLGDGALARKEYAPAEAYYRAFIALRPDSPIALNNLAWLSWKLGKPGALQYAERADRLAPNQASLMDTLAMLLAEGNQTERALDLQRRAVKLQPEAPGLRLNLAKLLIKSGDKAQAKSELETLARLGGAFSEQPEVGQLLKSL